MDSPNRESYLSSEVGSYRNTKKKGDDKMKQIKITRTYTSIILLCVIFSVTISPIQAKEEYNVVATLQAPEPTSNGCFGIDSKLFEGGLVVGVYQADVDGITSAGKAYIYDSDWKLKTTLPSPTPREGEAFGRQVDVYGDKLAIGNNRAAVGEFLEAGMVYLFDADGSLTHEIKAHIPGFWQRFGSEIVLGKDIILATEIGGIVEGVSHAGLVNIYDDKGDYIRNLTSPSKKPDGMFGYSIALNDEYILVGESGHIGRSMIPKVCSVYIYDYDWNHVTTLNAPNKEERTIFGISTSMSSDYVVVGEPWATVDGIEKAGKAHIFSTEWNHIATLQSPTPEALAEFGRDVAMGGDIIVVGERKADVDAMNEGKVYVYDLEGILVASLVSPESAVSAMFGYSVETDGEIIVVGETDAEVDGVSKAGKVYIFSLGESTVEQPAKVEETTKTKSDSDTEKSGGIPGFPFESIVLSIGCAILVLWLIQRRH